MSRPAQHYGKVEPTDQFTQLQVSNNFGLLDNSQLRTQGLEIEDVEERDVDDSGLKKPKWGKFQAAVTKLNREAPKNLKYKVMYLARHGQGYHVRLQIPKPITSSSSAS